MPKKKTTEFDIIAKRNIKMESKNRQLDYKYDKMISLRKEKLMQKKKNELDRIEKKYRKMMDVELHNLKNKRKRKLPTDKCISKIKAKALKEIQLYAKLSRAVYSTEGPKIMIVDKKIWVPLDKKVNAGHCYPQHNYPHMAFNIQNIRPISSGENRRQADTVGERINNLPNSTIGHLRNEAEKKFEKRKPYCREFYQQIIDEYKELNKKEYDRLSGLACIG